MLSRLSKLDGEFPRANLRLPGLLVLTAFAACGGKHFTADPSASGNAGSSGASGGSGDSSATAGGGDTTAGGGDSGSGGDDAGSANGGSDDLGGKGGSVATAGGAGKGATGCASCGAGMYCQDGSNKCRSCADFSRLEFAAPQPLSTLSHSTGSSERFPRSAGSGSSLFYTEDGVARREIWYAAAPTSGMGTAIEDASAPLLGNDSGPLLAPGLGLGDTNFFFDRAEVATGLRKIMVANWKASSLSDVAAASSPTNVQGSSDYSFAAAPSAGHAYWMSTRNGTPTLTWESIAEGALQVPDALSLKIRIGANTECGRLGDDATPWVNLNGTLLLFSAESMADTCEPNDSHAHDLFAVPLAKSGLPAGAAIPLSALNNTGGGSDETDPSLSPDSCSIYFASDNGSGKYDVYRATRD